MLQSLFLARTVMAWRDDGALSDGWVGGGGGFSQSVSNVWQAINFLQTCKLVRFELVGW